VVEHHILKAYVGMKVVFLEILINDKRFKEFLKVLLCSVSNKILSIRIIMYYTHLTGN